MRWNTLLCTEIHHNARLTFYSSIQLTEILKYTPFIAVHLDTNTKAQRQKQRHKYTAMHCTYIWERSKTQAQWYKYNKKQCTNTCNRSALRFWERSKTQSAEELFLLEAEFLASIHGQRGVRALNCRKNHLLLLIFRLFILKYPRSNFLRCSQRFANYQYATH